MKKSPRVVRTLGLGVLLALSAGAVYAQNRERFGISARAGGVNTVNGRAMVTRTGQSAQLLSSQDDLVSGDTVTTGPGSQIEVLLNPGSYLRVAENSEFTLVNSSLDKLLIKLVKGSAVIEATSGDESALRINILANQQHLVIIRGGIYRVNVQPGSTELLVRKGRVLLNNDPREMMKGGTMITFAAGPPVTAKLSKKDQDAFDLWSKQRAETLARANQKISARAINGYLAGMTPFEWAFSAANPWGLWTFSGFSHCFTFVPFHYGWSSPYGHYFGNYYNVWPYYGAPGYGGNSVIVRNPGSGGSSSGIPGGSSTGSSTGSNGSSGSPGIGSGAPSSSMGSQAGPRDPDSGSRSVNRIKDQ